MQQHTSSTIMHPQAVIKKIERPDKVQYIHVVSNSSSSSSSSSSNNSNNSNFSCNAGPGDPWPGSLTITHSADLHCGFNSSNHHHHHHSFIVLYLISYNDRPSSERRLARADCLSHKQLSQPQLNKRRNFGFGHSNNDMLIYINSILKLWKTQLFLYELMIALYIRYLLINQTLVTNVEILQKCVRINYLSITLHLAIKSPNS